MKINRYYVITSWILIASAACLCTMSLLVADERASSQPTVDESQPNRVARYGIDQRIPWTTSRITGSPEPPLPYQLIRAFPKLKFEQPVDITSAPDTDRLFVVELNGKIFSFPNDQQIAEPDLAMDLMAAIPDATRVYGLTFHPEFERNRFCYISYIRQPEDPDGTQVSRFMVSNTDVPVIDPNSEFRIITWKAGGHNGACLKFGPDGYLYVSTGDGSGAFPPDSLHAGQDVSSLLAAILRIDVDHPTAETAYSIPEDNPFVDHAGARGEIWSYGFRNPWKMSFDSTTGDLWVGDVGWELWELVYRVVRGGNYGWSIVEGSQPVHPERKRGPTPILPPTVQHSHIESRSVTGGYVYHGARLPDLEGEYIYGDYVTGKIWGLRHDGQAVVELQELADTTIQIISFAVDNTDELLVMDYSGTLHYLQANPRLESNLDFPTRLTETGLFASVPDHQMADGVVPYSINAEPWADGAIPSRFLAVPEAGTIGVWRDQNVQQGQVKGDWAFPSDTVLAKTLSMEMEKGNPESLRHLETQILHYDQDTWRGYTYIWNDEQTDAVLSDPDGEDRVFTVQDATAPGGQLELQWHFASRAECLLCHTTRSGSIHGFRLEQLNRDHAYGPVTGNQLATLEHLGLFDDPLPESPPKITDPYDASADINERARAYLHINCAHCHRRGGGGTAAIDVQHHHSLQKTNLLDARPTQGTFGIHSAEVLAPGNPYRSVLYYRMAKLGRGRMPYFGSTIVDERGVGLIHDWIASLSTVAQSPGSDEVAEQEAKQSLTKLLQRTQDRKFDSATLAADVKDILASTSGALVTLHAIDDGRINGDLQQMIVDAAASHVDVQVRDLFERFLPDDRRSKRLGAAIKPDQILSIAGNAERGRELFLKSAGVQCRNCHRIDNQGKQVGPDLNEIGKKSTRAQILESILEPSKKIETPYLTYLVETANGIVHTGLLVKQGPEGIVLKDALGNDVQVSADDVEVLVPQPKSLMPDLLLRDMTAQEVADLLEFLTTLKNAP